jgi:hypothetical protein
MSPKASLCRSDDASSWLGLVLVRSVNLSNGWLVLDCDADAVCSSYLRLKMLMVSQLDKKGKRFLVCCLFCILCKLFSLAETRP